jgi:hypothetical protein
MSAMKKCPSGNRTMSDKLQFINLIGNLPKTQMALLSARSERMPA